MKVGKYSGRRYPDNFPDADLRRFENIFRSTPQKYGRDFPVCKVNFKGIEDGVKFKKGFTYAIVDTHINPMGGNETAFVISNGKDTHTFSVWEAVKYFNWHNSLYRSRLYVIANKQRGAFPITTTRPKANTKVPKQKEAPAVAPIREHSKFVAKLEELRRKVMASKKGKTR